MYGLLLVPGGGLGTKIQTEIRKGNQPKSGGSMEGEKEVEKSGSAFASDPLQEQHSHRRATRDDAWVTHLDTHQKTIPLRILGLLSASKAISLTTQGSTRDLSRP